jgi:hypothetical protein
MTLPEGPESQTLITSPALPPAPPLDLDTIWMPAHKKSAIAAACAMTEIANHGLENFIGLRRPFYFRSVNYMKIGDLIISLIIAHQLALPCIGAACDVG